MKFDFIVLGATGEQGSIASRDLLNSGYSVLLCGRDPSRIQHILKHKKAKFSYIDVTNINNTAKVIKDSRAKIVLNCVELKYNLNVMKACLKVNVNYLDLGGLQEMTINQYKLYNAFKKRRLIALLGCGSTPGIANVMAKHAVNQFNTISHIDLGFAWNSNIKKFVMPYSIESIIYELTTPPVVLEKMKFVKTKTCEFQGLKEVKGIGKQYLYCIVHSEVYTFYKYFKHKGLKDIHYIAGFPEHSNEVLKVLMDLKLDSHDTIQINGSKIKIIDFTREVLKRIEKPKDYKEIESVWVEVIGNKNNQTKSILISCITETLKGFESSGSNVNTGMPISIMAQLILINKINTTGVTSPEEAVPCKEFFNELSKRGIKIYQDGKRIN